MKVIVTGPISHLCPYRDEVDYGNVAITFEVERGDVPELHDIAGYLRDLRTMSASHEDITRQILDNTDAARVVTKWTTAGMDVTCDLSRESDR